jgi:hypothetical protein
MTDLIVRQAENTDLALYEANRIDGFVAAWLNAKAGKSGSHETLSAYRDSMADFRAVLHSVGLDLDGDPHLITLAAQSWAGSSKVGREVAHSTSV